MAKLPDAQPHAVFLWEARANVDPGPPVWSDDAWCAGTLPVQCEFIDFDITIHDVSETQERLIRTEVVRVPVRAVASIDEGLASLQDAEVSERIAAAIRIRVMNDQLFVWLTESVRQALPADVAVALRITVTDEEGHSTSASSWHALFDDCHVSAMRSQNGDTETVPVMGLHAVRDRADELISVHIDGDKWVALRDFHSRFYWSGHLDFTIKGANIDR